MNTNKTLQRKHISRMVAYALTIAAASHSMTSYAEEIDKDKKTEKRCR